MSSSGSVTCWISQLKTGEQAAAQPLWESYFRRLVARARHKLAGVPRRVADEEDVASSAFDSFCRTAEQGRFPQLQDRLVIHTDSKAGNLVNSERRQKHGERKVLDAVALAKPQGNDAAPPLAKIFSHAPSPKFAAQATADCRRLLDRLAAPELQQVAVAKMESYTIVDESAVQLGVVPPTVKLRLLLIRRTWEQELPP
jgi:hypothetical protein